MRINLLPIDERPLSPNTLRWQFMVAFIGIILLLVVNAFGFILQSHVNQLEDQVRNAKQYTQILQQQKRAVDALETDVRSLQDQRERLTALQAQDAIPVAPALSSIAESVVDRLWIDYVGYTGNQFSVSGYTFAMPALSDYVSALTTAEWSVVMNQIERNQSDFIQFSLNLTKEATE